MTVLSTLGAAVAFLACATPAAVAAPGLILQLEVSPPRVAAGQAFRLRLHQRVTRDLVMDGVEHNDLSTEIRLQPVGGGAPIVLNGVMRSQREEPGQAPSYPRPLHVKAGEAWTSQLDLGKYAPPPPRGRYRITVSHRYGDTNSELAVSNTVEARVGD